MTITFSRTAQQLVKGAMQDLGVLPLGMEPEAEEYDYGVDRLNLMLKSLAADGVTPWTDEEGTVTFPANTAEMTLTPRPIDVTSASVQVSASYERAMNRWEMGEYDDVPNKTQSGEPLNYTIIETPTAVKMRVWPVPSSQTVISYRYQRVLEDVNGTPDVPQVWLEGLQAMLAVRLPALGPVPQDMAIKAAYHERRLYDMSRPESYIIESAM